MFRRKHSVFTEQYIFLYCNRQRVTDANNNLHDVYACCSVAFLHCWSKIVDIM